MSLNEAKKKVWGLHSTNYGTLQFASVDVTFPYKYFYSQRPCFLTDSLTVTQRQDSAHMSQDSLNCFVSLFILNTL